MRNKLLAKKVLCSVLAASVFGMAGSALAQILLIRKQMLT